jgi:hypothetical protein
MNFSELQRELKGLLMDQSNTILASVPDYINEAVQQVAEEVRLPELRQVSSITTSTSTYYVNMPSGFSSRLKYCGDSTGEYTILDTLEELIRLYPSLDEDGDISYVVCEGSILYYQPIPAVAKVLTCIGYHTPATLVNDTDTPSFIPDFLHRATVVNMAAANAYAAIEDGIEKEKVNTAVFTMLGQQGINKVREYVSRRRPVVSKSNWSC